MNNADAAISSSDLSQTLAKGAEDPRALELLFRQNPEAFRAALPAAMARHPESLVLQAWKERLRFDDASPSRMNLQFDAASLRQWITPILLALVATLLIKLPLFFSNLDPESFYPRNLGVIGTATLLAFFLLQRPCPRRWIVGLVAGVLATAVYLNCLPHPERSDTTILACLHAGFLGCSVVGLAFLSGAWRDLKGRMNYLRYVGELVIYTTIIGIGGIVLTVLTVALFDLLDLKIEEWYMRNVGLYGAVLTPLVASLLITRVIDSRFRLAPLLAKVFTPLFLVMLLIYLAAMVINRQSPFTDRDFLIAFNGLLLLVLGLCVFSISERGNSTTATPIDGLNISLVAVTLLVDIVALAAIVFRLSSYGFTPNRVAVMGANLLAFAHLAGILWHYLRFARQKQTIDALEVWIVRFIPIYNLWGAAVVLLLPVLFGFA